MEMGVLAEVSCTDPTAYTSAKDGQVYRPAYSLSLYL